MKLLITGGHFSPALAIIEKLRQDNEILVVGRKTAFEGDSTLSYEYIVCKQLNIHFQEIRTGRLSRKFTRHSIPSVFKMPLGLADAARIIHKFKPDVILTFGGYIGLPVAFAAFSSKIPIIIHEQTLGAGLSNKIIGKFATKICISFESSRKYFTQSKIVLTGNPIRSEVFEVKKGLDEIGDLAYRPASLSRQRGEPAGAGSLPIIYITGGSTGAHAINDIVLQTIKKLLENYIIIHQTGESNLTHDYEKLTELRNNLPQNLKKRYVLRKYIMPGEIGWVLSVANLIIARAGINTVCEILALEKVCLLIPLPHGQKEEQLANAKLIQKVGTGEYILQNDLNPNSLLSKIDLIMTHIQDYQVHRKDALKLIFPDATFRLINVIQSLYEKKTSEKKSSVSS